MLLSELVLEDGFWYRESFRQIGMLVCHFVTNAQSSQNSGVPGLESQNRVRTWETS